MTDALIAAHIGLPHEPVGIVMLQRHEELVGEFDNIRKRWRTRVRYSIERIERPEAGARLTEVAGLVEGLCRQQCSRLSLLTNVTSSGQPPVQLMRDRNLKPVAIVTTQADATRRGRGAIHVPQKELVTSLSILLAERRLTVPNDAPNADCLREQMREFRAKPKPKSAVEPWREQETGELVMAVALAGWWGETRLSSLVRQPPPPRQPVPPPRWPTFNEMLQSSRRARMARNARI